MGVSTRHEWQALKEIALKLSFSEVLGKEELFISCIWLFPNSEFIFESLDWQSLEHFYTLQWVSLQV